MHNLILIFCVLSVKTSAEVDPRLVNSGHGQGFYAGRNGNNIGGQGFNPGRNGNNIGGQGFNPGSNGNNIGGQGFNSGRSRNNNGGQGFNPGRNGNNIGGQGFNPGGGLNPGRKIGGNFVAFTAVRAQHGTGTGRLRLERTLTNLGFGWDRGTSSLKVVEPGTFHFSWSALSPHNTELRLSLMRNGKEQVASWADSDGFNTASGAALLQLDAGDEVYLDVTGGVVYEPTDSNRPYTSFTGFKIY